ncbi:membrane protein [Kitasatospora kazusensis]|uniref:Membrane protein n=1 Tax=Kitasatospora kazusensis TaxID=407974 RepID=A0ABN3A336_9ACTN
MAKFLLSLHVLASVLFIGPVAVAVSMFPRRAQAALAAGAEGAEQVSAAASVRLLHRITQIYALLGIAVPLMGVGTAQVMGIIGQTWLIVSIVLTVLAAATLMLFVLPAQQAVVDALQSGAEPAGEDRTRATGGLRLLPMTAGVFNLLWAVVVVMMVIRPGSTTGA